MSTNAPEFSVSELAGAVKRTIEETFGRVRVRGELGRVTIARSGHCYLDLKDDRAVINSIVWKGTMSKLRLRPEEGMEVVVEGRMSTYPGRSNYQLVIDRMELAGAGALMALLEKRRAMFAAEGLFDRDRKQALPYLPRTIGVVTSETGAVIRDILHRVEDRFPSRVILWPVLVQGDRAAAQIAAAITGFNAYEPTARLPRPDVLIVGRGGGSVEDLWPFNEEVVVRAAANSRIPLISAVGHETDTTLIDYVSDARAPTPTGAAEIAVPVRRDLMFALDELGLRLARALQRGSGEARARLRAARLPAPDALLSRPSQRLDIAVASLPGPRALLDPLRLRLGRAALTSPRQLIATKAATLRGLRLPDPARSLRDKSRDLAALAARLRPAVAAVRERELAGLARARLRLGSADAALARAGRARLDRAGETLSRAGSLLDALSYQGVLARGFALVTDETGEIVRSRDAVEAGERVGLEFADGTRRATIDGHGKMSVARKPRKRVIDARPTGQRSLF